MGQAELTSHIGLQLCEEDVGRRVGTCHKRADTANQRGEERIEAARDCHEADSDGRNHARIVHHRRHGDKADDGDNNDKVNDAESITFDIIKQMYSPLIKDRNSQNTNDVDEDEDGDENIEASSIITKDNADDLTDEEKKSISDNLQAIEEHIKQKSGLSVNLRLNRDGSGMVEIEYNDAEELIAIVNRLQ